MFSIFDRVEYESDAVVVFVEVTVEPVDQLNLSMMVVVVLVLF